MGHMKKILLALLGFWLTMAAAVAEAPFNDDVPESYIVKKGDTLWDISEHFLSQPWLWPEIWYANPQIENPHLIYPGDDVNLVYVDGKRRLMVNRGRNVKLSPQIRESSHREPIAAIPLEAIDSFLSRTRVLDNNELAAAPYIVSGEETRLVVGTGDDFYARGDFSSNVGVYGIYRSGDPYIDPATHELLGIRGEDIGSAKLKRVSDEIGTFGISRSVTAVLVNDRLLEEEERRIDTTFHPSQPQENTEGLIISVEGGVNNAGFLDVVAVNLGDREGLKTGNLLAVYKSGETVKDRVAGEYITLPAEKVGLLMVFRTFEKMSYGLILNADRPLAIGDSLKNP
jgi:hypothetical protein